MAGRPKEFDELDILDKAIEIFWVKGYESASANELLNAMNIGKGSFYTEFKGGKKELFEKCLERFSDRSYQLFEAKLSKAATPVEFIKSFFLSLPNLPTERKLRGCYLGNAITEMAGIDTQLKDKASLLLGNLETRFEMILNDAQNQGLLKTKQPANILALHLVNLWNGINITQKLNPHDDRIYDLIEMNLEMIR